MRKIYAITDYKGHFGSKWLSLPYRSGYDQRKLQDYFKDYGLSLEFKRPIEIHFSKEEWNGKTVLLTSSEEPGLEYKRHIEDLAYGLEQCGANVLPGSDFISAHENKIRSAILQNLQLNDSFRLLDYSIYGNYEELHQYLKTGKQKFPCIVKKPSGSKGTGVFLVQNRKELRHVAKKISTQGNIIDRIKEKIRGIRHKGYIQNSSRTKRFLIQEFAPNLKCDWKVLIYGTRIYILRRNIKSNDFRASGSGIGYTAGSESEFPITYLEPLYQFFLGLKVPNLSLDFGFDGHEGFIFEFQALYFGTSTQFKSKDYYKKNDDQWVVNKNEFDQEQIFVSSIAEFIQNK
jgi:hypothetical protein